MMDDGHVVDLIGSLCVVSSQLLSSSIVIMVVQVKMVVEGRLRRMGGVSVSACARLSAVMHKSKIFYVE